MWFGAPLAAYSSGATSSSAPVWGLLFANGFARLVIAAGAYNTGLWSAAFLFVPLSIWALCPHS
jgi:hypothetical protein